MEATVAVRPPVGASQFCQNPEASQIHEMVPVQIRALQRQQRLRGRLPEVHAPQQRAGYLLEIGAASFPGVGTPSPLPLSPPPTLTNCYLNVIPVSIRVWRRLPGACACFLKGFLNFFY